MKLYYAPGACSLADHIVLEWIGAPYQAVRLSHADMKAPDFLRINPAGAVPALEDDGWVLTQNSAILNYLADLHPDAGLAGDGSAKSRAEVNKWLAFLNSDLHPTFKPLFGTTAYLEDAEAIERSKDDASKKLRGLFERADAQLAGQDWLSGSRSIADPYLYVVLRWAHKTGVDLADLDNLARFSQRMESDPAVQRVLAEEGLG